MGRVKAIVVSTIIVMVGITLLFFFTEDKKTQDTMGISQNAKQNEDSIEESQYNAINTLVQDYYAKLAFQDMDGLAQIMDKVDDNTIVQIENNKKFVEGYQNVEVYTKKDKNHNGLIVFACYKMKIKEINTLVPGLGTLYVAQDENQVWHIINSFGNSDVQDAIQLVLKDDDVQSLMKTVQKEYTQAVESDETLKVALTEFQAAYAETSH